MVSKDGELAMVLLTMNFIRPFGIIIDISFIFFLSKIFVNVNVFIEPSGNNNINGLSLSTSCFNILNLIENGGFVITTSHCFKYCCPCGLKKSSPC